MISKSILGFAALALGSAFAGAQLSTFGGNAQHTNNYTPAAANINRILWQTPIDTSNSGAFAHYGEPLITANNTVIVPVLTSSTTVLLNAFDGATGNFKYTLSTDYTMPSYSWVPPYDPVICGTRLYYPGAGGTVYYVDNIDSNTPTAPTQLCFYTSLSNYSANAAGYNSSVYINTPITADSQGNIFFGFRMQGTPIAPFSANGSGQPVSGYARISNAGVGNYVMVDAMTGDTSIAMDSHAAAPALSNDESTVYVVAKKYNYAYYAYICGLDSTTLATKYKRFITDPRPGGSAAGPIDQSTACPLIAPDGDVYMGMFVTPYNGSRGYLAHYSSDLSVVKTPGAFGWDFTPGIVPASMVPSYHGKSSYLLFCKYNNYDTGGGSSDGGDEINTVAILDPEDETQIDWHPQAAGMTEMREVLTMIGPTANSEVIDPNSVREWCVNATAVNPATDSVFFNSEDGKAYRWNLTQNSLEQCLTLTTGFGVPYVPSFIGPDGTAYTFNGTYLFAMGAVPGVAVTMDSDHPDARTTVLGDNVTFTANVNDPSATGASTVTFTDLAFDNYTPVTTTLGTVPLVNGHASISTSTLMAGSYNAGADIYLGSHFISATYNQDGTNPTASIMRVQKVHWYPSTTALNVVSNPTAFGTSVQLTATVTGPANSGVPTAMLTFLDGNKVLGQQRLDGTGAATMTVTGLTAGVHDLTAVYVGDTQFATSSRIVETTVTDGTTTTLGLSPNPSTFGQSVTMTATVASADNGAGIPTGSVTFTDGVNTLGTGTVDGTGKATLSTSALTVGSHSITASFTGTNGWGNSASTPSSQQVNDGTTTTVAGSPNPATFGSSVQFTATVAAADNGAGTPTGSVVFTIDGNAGSPVTVDGTGHAAYSTSSLTVGSHTVSAAFTGTGGWQNSNGSGSNENVTDGTGTSLGSSPNPSNYSHSVTFTATVTSNGTGGGVPTGSVAFTEGATTLATVTVDGTGNAAFSTSSLSFGSHTITASFTGTGGYQNSSGQTTQAVGDTTTTGVASSLNPSVTGQSVTFTATVTASDAGAGTPTGSVAFKDGATTLATVTVDGTGHAAYSTSSLSIAAHTITAAFSGTNGWQNSTSGNLSQVVTADTTAPSVPQNVTAISGPARGQITVSWSRSTDPDDAVDHYEIWKSTKLNGSFTLLTTVTGTSYVDNAGRNQTRYYYIIAVDSHGNKSAPSAKTGGTGLARAAVTGNGNGNEGNGLGDGGSEGGNS